MGEEGRARTVALPGGASWSVRELGAGPPVCLLHGFALAGRSWWGGPAEALAAGRRVLAPDLPGHGSTPAPPGSEDTRMERVADRLHQALDALAAGPVDLVGYSMGARLALAAALARPDRVRRLVLESGSPGLRTEAERAARRAADAELAEGLLRDGLGPFLERWSALPLFDSQRGLPAEVLAAERRSRAAQDPVGLARSLLGMGTGSQPSCWERLGELRLPVLVLVGSLDGKFRAIGEEMVALLPLAELRVVEGVGHRVHLEAPARWIEEVRAFLG